MSGWIACQNPETVRLSRPGPGWTVLYGLLGDVDFVQEAEMRASYQPQLGAAVCGTCHQDRNDPDGDGDFEDEDGAVSEPTYQEWLESPYADPSSDRYATCVDCHMEPTGEHAACSVAPRGLLRPAGDVRSHRFPGTTADMLESAVSLEMTTRLAGDRIEVEVTVTNDRTGHHVPTGVTIRNVILVVEAWRAQDGARLESLGAQTIHALGGEGDPAAGYFAGLPGKLYAKINHGPDGDGPVFYTEATGILSDTRLAPLASDTTAYAFRLPEDGGELHVSARLIYRRAWRALVDAKGWTTDGHGRPLEDLAPPHFGHLMEQAERVHVRPGYPTDAGTDAGADAGSGDAPPADGCGCRPVTGHGGAPASIVGLLALVVLGRRRSRRRGRTALGIDVGSTTAKAVVVSEDGDLLAHACRRHRGRPRDVAREVIEAVSADTTERGITGSLGVALADELGAVSVHEVLAVALAVGARAPGTRSVVELGGQDAKLLTLEPRGDHHAEMNDRCAAGTGATLDRIAHRLGLEPTDLSHLRLVGDLRVASRCGVFAETDVVNLVKRGASREEAMGALARAIVAQNLTVLARGRTLHQPLLLLGGPHEHLPVLAEAWAEALGDAWVPPHAELFAAVGAALHVLRGGRPHPTIRGVAEGQRTDPPLLRHARDRDLLRNLGTVLRNATSVRKVSLRRTVPKLRLGIDAGSTTSKAVLLDGEGRLVASSYAPSAGDPVADAVARVGELRRQVPDARVGSVGVTGYGADLVGPAIGADWVGVETLAHAAAAAAHAPDAEVVVDVGGTDVKVLRLDGGRLAGFHVSNQCSAGHGAFLAAAAADMGVPLAQYAERALSARRMPRFTVGCGIFVDTDRVTFQRDGWTVDEILAGLAWALARNVFEYVLPEPVERLGRSFLLTGGTMHNGAAAFALARYLVDRIPDARVAVHPHPGLGGAIGAALGATHVGETSFIGLDALSSLRTTVRSHESLRCGRCELACPRSLVTLERGAADAARTLVLGNACERGADPDSTGRRTRRHAPDLLAEEAVRLFRPLLPRPAPPPLPRRPPVLGVPRVMAMYRSAPLLLHYLRAAGVPEDHLVISPPTSELLSGGRAVARGVHDPCFPSKIVLTHVEWLLEQSVDTLLLPAITHARIAVRGTADTASCPIVAACGHVALAALARDPERTRDGVHAVTPELCLVDPQRLDRQLHETFGPLLGLDADTHRDALRYALRAQATFHERCRRRGRRLLERARREGTAVAVVLARPYHADPGVQHGVSTELAARGIPVVSIGSLPIDEGSLDLSDLLPEVTNSGCAEKVWAARRIATDPHLVAVDLSSFRCGQDASVLGLVGEILDGARKPVLYLHDLDEDRPAASLSLRIRSFVATVRRYEREHLGGTGLGRRPTAYEGPA